MTTSRRSFITGLVSLVAMSLLLCACEDRGAASQTRLERALLEYGYICAKTGDTLDQCQEHIDSAFGAAGISR